MKKLILKLFLVGVSTVGFLSANVIGSVTRTKGVVNIDRMGGAIRVVDGTNIENKDIISTQNNSLARVQMIDGAVVNIGENSIFGFQNYLFNKKKMKAHMILQRGFFRIKSGKIGKLAPNKFRVDTKTAVIGVRGTNFYALIDGNYEDIGCLRGEIFVDTSTQRYYVSEGERLVKENGRWQKRTIPSQIMDRPNRILQTQRGLRANIATICPAGQVWSEYMQRCILAPNNTGTVTPPPAVSPQRPVVESKPCRRAGMVRDPETNRCLCPEGTSWSKAMNMCASEAQKRDYCSRTYPGSIPALNEKECECPKPLWWSNSNQKCIDPVEYCEERIDGSEPVFTKDNQIKCECPKGYYLGKNTNKCYRYTPKPHRRAHRRPHHRPVVVHRQRPVRVERHQPNYVVPALIGAAVIGGAIISHHHHKKHRRHHRRHQRHHY